MLLPGLGFTSLLNKLKLYFSNKQGTPEKQTGPQRFGTGGLKDSPNYP